jgi:hypothetical protein
MAKSTKSRKTPAMAGFKAVALRTVAVRLGAAAAIVAAGAGLWSYHEHKAVVAAAPEPRLEIATVPAKPPQRLPLAPAPAPEPAATPLAEAAPTPEPPRRDASLDAKKPMSAPLRAAFDAWLMSAYAKCWRAPKTLPDGDPYLAKVRVALKEDGGLAAPPKLVNPPSDPAWKAHADAALKAVKGCDPLHVPDKYAEYYPSWKSKTVYFDPSLN